MKAPTKKFQNSESDDNEAGYQPKKVVKVVKKKILPKKRKRDSSDEKSVGKKSVGKKSVGKKSARSNSIDGDLKGIGNDLPTKRFKETESQPSAGIAKLL